MVHKALLTTINVHMPTCSTNGVSQRYSTSGGGSEVITVQMIGSSGAATGASKSTRLEVFLSGADQVTRDAVQARTTVVNTGAISE